MRPTLPWLLLAVLAACSGRGESARFAGTSERWARRDELNAARVDLSLRTLLDSLPARLAALPERSVIVVGPADWERSVTPESARARLAAIWNRAADSASGMRLLVWFYRPKPDTADLSEQGAGALVRPGSGFVGSFMPEATDGRTCVVTLPVEPQWDWTEARENTWGMWALPACVFRARFGPPGPAMAKWLTATDYSAVSSLRWLQGHGPERSPWAAEDVFHGMAGTDWLHPSMLLYAWHATQGDLVPYFAGPAGVRCAAGLAGGCRDAVLGDSAWRRSRVRRPAGVAQWETSWYGLEVFRRPVWISELIRREGEARFRRWWRSNTGLEEGFRAAYGQSIDESAREFVRIDWQLRGGARPIRLGTPIDPGSVATVVAWLALFLALPLAAARRRATAP